ncbi:hypothetical protein BBJ28_00011026, partial [Nothophytophthora sp. Chile5]
MFSHGNARGVAVVVPLPPGLPSRNQDPIKKVAGDAGDDDDDGSGRDDLPLLKATNSSDEASKITDDGPATIVLTADTASPACWTMSRVQGLAYIVFAAFNFSIVSACVKFASHRVSSHETVFWRMVVGLAMNFVWIYHKKTSLHKVEVSVVCEQAAVVLGEAIDKVDLVGGITSFIGVLLVTRPAVLFPATATPNAAPMAAILCAMGGSVSQAIVYTIMRKMRDVDNLVTIHYFLVFGTCYSILMLWFFDVTVQMPLEPTFLFAIFGSGFFSYVGQIFLTKGFQTEKAGIASVMRYFDVVFVMGIDAAVLGEHVNLYSVLGAAIIISGASMVVMRRARRQFLPCSTAHTQPTVYAMIAPIHGELQRGNDGRACVRLQVVDEEAGDAVDGKNASVSSQETKPATPQSTEYGGATGWRSPRARALGYIAFAALNLSLMRVCVKYASRQVTSHETVLWRSGVAWLLNLVLVHRNKTSLFVEAKRRKLLFWRCFFGTFGISIQFYAMAQMVLTDAVVIIFTSPIVTFML